MSIAKANMAKGWFATAVVLWAFLAFATWSPFGPEPPRRYRGF